MEEVSLPDRWEPGTLAAPGGSGSPRVLLREIPLGGKKEKREGGTWTEIEGTTGLLHKAWSIEGVKPLGAPSRMRAFRGGIFIPSRIIRIGALGPQESSALLKSGFGSRTWAVVSRQRKRIKAVRSC